MFRGAAGNRGLEPGVYAATLVRIDAGLIASQFHPEEIPALRVVVEAEGTHLSRVVNIPTLVPVEGGGYGLRWSQRGVFWSLAGALAGRPIGAEEAHLVGLEIPGVSSPEDLRSLPPLYGGEELPPQAHIWFGDHLISEAGRPLLITVEQRAGRDGGVMAVIVAWSPPPRSG